MHVYGHKEKSANKAVGKARNDREANVYTKLDQDAGKKVIYKMARHRNECSSDVKRETVIKTYMGS